MSITPAWETGLQHNSGQTHSQNTCPKSFKNTKLFWSIWFSCPEVLLPATSTLASPALQVVAIPLVLHWSCPQVPFDLPAVKPTHAQYHLQCLKWRTCSLLLGTSTATSNQHNKAKIPGRKTCRDVTRISLFSEHPETGCISSPFTNLWSPQIPLDFSVTFCLSVLSALWAVAALTTRMEGIQPSSSYSLWAGTRDPGGSSDMTWSDSKGGRQPRPGKSPRLCFWFSSCTIKEVSEFLLNGFQNPLQRKKKKNPVRVHLRLIITGIIMIYSHHKSWRERKCFWGLQDLLDDKRKTQL